MNGSRLSYVLSVSSSWTYKVRVASGNKDSLLGDWRWQSNGLWWPSFASSLRSVRNPSAPFISVRPPQWQLQLYRQSQRPPTQILSSRCDSVTTAPRSARLPHGEIRAARPPSRQLTSGILRFNLMPNFPWIFSLRFKYLSQVLYLTLRIHLS